MKLCSCSIWCCKMGLIGSSCKEIHQCMFLIRLFSHGFWFCYQVYLNHAVHNVNTILKIFIETICSLLSERFVVLRLLMGVGKNNQIFITVLSITIPQTENTEKNNKRSFYLKGRKQRHSPSYISRIVFYLHNYIHCT